MGCSQSNDAGNDGSNPDERDDKRQGRQRTAMRRTGGSSARGRRYQADSEVGSSRGGSQRNTPRSLADTRDSMLNSDVGASNLIMSQRSSFRSFNFSSPRPTGGGMTPRSGVGVGGSGRPPIPPAARVLDRRVSVGRFADEPSDLEFRARLAAAIAKAKTIHGIDGSVDEVNDRALRQNAKAGVALLGDLGVKRIEAWIDDVYACSTEVPSVSPAASTPQTVDHRLSADDLIMPGTADTTPLPNAVAVDAECTPTAGQILPNSSTHVDGEDDVSSMMFLSGKPVAAPRQKLSAETLKQNHDAVVKENSDAANLLLYVTRPRRASRASEGAALR
eukprot:CAMPEP_0174828060 /NCGR_PEP_ID=MMETSP1114-20130205/1110_1 /TAXON_ID=312471 /ORGANISM="Neobodo designis, Strain CCAP 1951/1" /LENGTH=332 /DNA_ID=CAMNT_0016061763 /DNA_START=35 /DNA_END=1033 /DNA_ORIENTATION=+